MADVFKNKLLVCFFGALFLLLFAGLPYADALTIGDRVQTIGGIFVRSRPQISYFGTLGFQLKGSSGTIVDGPKTGSGYTWWNVNYDSGADGWSAEKYLIPAASAVNNSQDYLLNLIAQLKAKIVALQAQIAALQSQTPAISSNSNAAANLPVQTSPAQTSPTAATPANQPPQTSQNASSSQTFFGVKIPAIIQAEDYSTGGQGIGYYDTTPGNSGGAYRKDDVDIEASSEGGYDVGWIAAGEWLKYDIFVPAAGSYGFELRIARWTAGNGVAHLEIDGKNLASVSIPSTGSWQYWQSVNGSINLSAGQHTLKIVSETGDFNLDWIKFSTSGQVAVAPAPAQTISPIATTTANVTAPAAMPVPAPTAAYDGSRVGFNSRGRVVMGGSEHIVLGIYDTGGDITDGRYNYTSKQIEDVLFSTGGDLHNTRALKDTPFNVYLNYQKGADDINRILALMDVLKNHGVYWLETTNSFQNYSYAGGNFLADRNSGQYATTMATHSQMMGYYISDEPANEMLTETYNHQNTLAGYDSKGVNLLVFLGGFDGVANWVSRMSQAAGNVLFGVDEYPLYGVETSAGYPHFLVADYVARLREAVPASKPIVSVLQFFKFTSNSRLPSYAEMRTHAIMSFVEGAQGIFEWEPGINGLRNGDNNSTQVAQWMGYLQKLYTELKGVEPAILADPNPSLLAGNSTSMGDPVAWRKSVLQHNQDVVSPYNWFVGQAYQAELNALNSGDTSKSTMLKFNPQSGNIRTRASLANGKGYLFAYNYTNVNTPVNFTWYRPIQSVREVDGGRTYSVSGSSWSDTFGPSESHIYEITF